METPAAARRYGVRIDTLRDEPLLAALPATHDYANAGAIPIGAFAAERVLLPREPPGGAFNAWLSAVVRAAGFELERTLKTLSAPWDRRMLPVADGEAVSLVRRRVGGRADCGCRGCAVRSAAELSDRSRVVPQLTAGSCWRARPAVSATPKGG